MLLKGIKKKKARSLCQMEINGLIEADFIVYLTYNDRTQ